jgi:hypothetical protein
MNGTLLRLDESTEITLVSGDEIFLQSGRVYLDTMPGQAGDKAITIHTAQGLVRHLGTQFITQWSEHGLLISVREGEVLYQPLPDSQQEPAQAGAGQQLEVTTGGEISMEAIPTWGTEWAWAEALSPGFTSDGRSLADLFQWAGRELGRQVEYSPATAEAEAAATVLHGNLDVHPLQALSVATATSNFTTRLSEGRIIITISEGP